MFNHVQIPWKDAPATAEFEGQIRYYTTVTGERYPSITSVLGLKNEQSPHLKEWKERVGAAEALRVMNTTTLRGKNTHTLIEDYLHNKPLTNTANTFYYSLFLGVKKEIDRISNIHAIERALYSRRLKTAGSVDCIAEFDDVLSIIDFKTSTKEKRREWIDDYFTQTAFYADALFEMTGIVAPQLVIIIVDQYGVSNSYVEPTEKHIKNMRMVVNTYNPLRMAS